MRCETLSLSVRISESVFVPNIFLNVVIASNLVELDASKIFVTDIIGLLIR